MHARWAILYSIFPRLYFSMVFSCLIAIFCHTIQSGAPCLQIGKFFKFAIQLANEISLHRGNIEASCQKPWQHNIAGTFCRTNVWMDKFPLMGPEPVMAQRTRNYMLHIYLWALKSASSCWPEEKRNPDRAQLVRAGFLDFRRGLHGQSPWLSDWWEAVATLHNHVDTHRRIFWHHHKAAWKLIYAWHACMHVSCAWKNVFHGRHSTSIFKQVKKIIETWPCWREMGHTSQNNGPSSVWGFGLRVSQFAGRCSSGRGSTALNFLIASEVSVPSPSSCQQNTLRIKKHSERGDLNLDEFYQRENLTKSNRGMCDEIWKDILWYYCVAW